MLCNAMNMNLSVVCIYILLHRYLSGVGVVYSDVLVAITDERFILVVQVALLSSLRSTQDGQKVGYEG